MSLENTSESGYHRPNPETAEHLWRCFELAAFHSNFDLEEADKSALMVLYHLARCYDGTSKQLA